MNRAIDFLVELSGAESADKYYETQARAIDSLNGNSKELIQMVMDETLPKMMRFDAMQLITWVSPSDSESFFTGLMNCSDAEISELAKAMAYRLIIRKNVEDSHPDSLALYLRTLRLQSVQQLF